MRLCPAPPLTLLPAACGAVSNMGLTGGGSAVMGPASDMGRSFKAHAQKAPPRAAPRCDRRRQAICALEEAGMTSAPHLGQKHDRPCATDTQDRDTQVGTQPHHLPCINLPVPIGQRNQGIATGHSDPRLSKPRIIKRTALPYCPPCTADDVSESLAKNLGAAMKDALRNTAMAELMRKRD